MQVISKLGGRFNDGVSYWLLWQINTNGTTDEEYVTYMGKNGRAVNAYGGVWIVEGEWGGPAAFAVNVTTIQSTKKHESTKGTNLHEVFVCSGELGGFFVEPQITADERWYFTTNGQRKWWEL